MSFPNYLKLSTLILFLFYQNGYSQNDWQNAINKAWGGNFSPYIESNVGYGSPNHKSIEGDFSEIGTVDLRLGFTELKKYKDYIQALDERFVFGTYISSKPVQSSTSGLNEIKTEMWRFGIGNRLGYGYEMGPISLIPYNQLQLSLTKSKFTDTLNLSPGDIDTLNRIAGDYRMGTSFEGGVKLYVARTIAINAGVEGAIIFPRYKFMHWLGSFALQSISLGVVSYFSEAIINSSPFLGPIMYFVLKNGISAAWYFAMKKQMYPPIKSETPMAMETFRLGVSFTF